MERKTQLEPLSTARKKKSPDKDVPEIRKLRVAGMTLLSIGQRFGIGIRYEPNLLRET